MARQILEHGNYKVAICPDCNCKFTFEIIDVNENNQVACPECDALCSAQVKTANVSVETETPVAEVPVQTATKKK